MKKRLILVPLAVVVLTGALAMAQGQKNQAKWRTIKGTVVDKKGNPIGSALVRLKDLRARTVKMRPTDRDGQFTFTWLDPSVDYEVHAEQKNAVSEKLLISSSDKRREIVIKLRLVESTTK